MTREALMSAVKSTKADVREAIQIILDALNQGQKKQILKDEKVKALVDFYCVKTEE